MSQMVAMALVAHGEPLQLVERELPVPARGQIGVKVRACGVCRTDLHVVDNELPNIKLPIVPGHEIVGTVDALGEDAAAFKLGTRVGIPWLGRTCGQCFFCQNGLENLCDEPGFTGYSIDGGYANYVVADERYCFALPEGYDDMQAAPLLCAGLIGYRCLKAAGAGQNLGIYGFGAAAHICAQIAVHEGQSVYAFTRPGDQRACDFALEMGACWAGSSLDAAPQVLDAAIIFAPVGSLLPAALRMVRKGGTVVCGGIHMSDIPSFPYEILWGERKVVSVANLTREDAREFLALAPTIPIKTEVVPYQLSDANTALNDLRSGMLTGAAVLKP